MQKQHKARWSNSVLNRVIELYEKGCTPKRISKATFIPHKSIKMICYRNGLTRKIEKEWNKI